MMIAYVLTLHMHAGPRHALVSTFYNDMFAFDLERRRWYKLGLKQKKAKLSSTEKKEARRVKQKSAAEGADGADGDDQSDAGSEDEGSDLDVSDDEDEDGAKNTNLSGAVDAVRADKGDFFGYIDETGNVVYINLKDDDGEEGDGMQVDGDAAALAVPATESDQGSEMMVEDSTIQSTAEGFDKLAVSHSVPPAATATAADQADNVLQALRDKETLKNQLKYQARAGRGDALLIEGDAGPCVGAEDGGMQLDDVAVDVAAGGAVSGVKAGAGEHRILHWWCIGKKSTAHDVPRVVYIFNSLQNVCECVPSVAKRHHIRYFWHRKALRCAYCCWWCCSWRGATVCDCQILRRTDRAVRPHQSSHPYQVQLMYR